MRNISLIQIVLVLKICLCCLWTFLRWTWNFQKHSICSCSTQLDHAFDHSS